MSNLLAAALVRSTNIRQLVYHRRGIADPRQTVPNERIPRSSAASLVGPSWQRIDDGLAVSRP